jgi:hypothetical protein
MIALFMNGECERNLRRLRKSPTLGCDNCTKGGLTVTANGRTGFGPEPMALGSGLIDQSQKQNVAAMVMADMNVCAQRS